MPRGFSTSSLITSYASYSSGSQNSSPEPHWCSAVPTIKINYRRIFLFCQTSTTHQDDPRTSPENTLTHLSTLRRLTQLCIASNRMVQLLLVHCCICLELILIRVSRVFLCIFLYSPTLCYLSWVTHHADNWQLTVVSDPRHERINPPFYIRFILYVLCTALGLSLYYLAIQPLAAKVL